MKEGVLVINKPKGMTSHDVVQIIRRKFGIRRVGHAGTLDPMATGVLVLLVGKSTQLFNRFVNFEKTYKATLRLGLKTDTADIQGKIVREAEYQHLPLERIRKIFSEFSGEIDQIPPMVSAVKWKGKRLYELARAGTVVERQPRKVNIKSLTIEETALPDVKFYLECSKGTYVRQLAEDIGERLGCGACITEIQRTAVGPFTLKEAVSLEDAHVDHIRHWEK